MGIDIKQIQEINRHVQTAPVPHAPEVIRGVINLRGDVVTVLDLRTSLGLPDTEISGETRCVIVEWAGEKTGLLVDRIADVVTVDPGEMEPAPVNVAGIDAKYFLGVCKMERELLIALDVEQIMLVEERDVATS
jgi:purine-binding chemotaxis protein CheW